MTFFSSISQEDLRQFHRILMRSLEARSHRDVLHWLQGDIQRYLPHDIMIAAWGNFSTGMVKHDIISTLPGVRSSNANPATLTPLLLQLSAYWKMRDRKPFVIDLGEEGFTLRDTGRKCLIGDALHTMRAAMVHGICDERGSHDCVYVSFTANEFSATHLSAMGLLMPYIDTALRQVEHLPRQAHAHIDTRNGQEALEAQGATRLDLSERELEILQWVSIGKTNPEIGSILEISEFTVKNHMQRVFRKLDVSNRAQAVGKLNSMLFNG